jgi:hypothetical protein
MLVFKLPDLHVSGLEIKYDEIQNCALILLGIVNLIIVQAACFFGVFISQAIEFLSYLAKKESHTVLERRIR